MTKYICSQCTGRSGEEHTFRLGEQPKACPYNGCPERYVQTIESYLREQLEDARFETGLKEDKIDDLREEIETLKTDTDQY